MKLILQTLIQQVHPEWHELLKKALSTMSDDYLQSLQSSDEWLPHQNHLFAAFNLPLSKTSYILFGESPYPREQSANGYAFWDNSVGSIWSPTGLSKEVNRATSLRNLIKMLLFARGDLQSDFSQEAIAQLNKEHYIQTASQLFHSFMRHGFLLLNASLVYSKGKVNYHAKHWRPFVHSLLVQLVEDKPDLQLVLLGKVAKEIYEANRFASFVAEHPYNISFITNPSVVAFFKPLDLLAHQHEEIIN